MVSKAQKKKLARKQHYESEKLQQLVSEPAEKVCLKEKRKELNKKNYAKNNTATFRQVRKHKRYESKRYQLLSIFKEQ